MTNIRRTIAAVATAGLLATPLAVLAASPASADADREWRWAGAKHEFDVEKDDGRFEIDYDLDNAKPGSKWRVVIRHDGKVIHKKRHRADDDGGFDIEKSRRNTSGKDVFKVTVKKVGKSGSTTRKIVRR